MIPGINLVAGPISAVSLIGINIIFGLIAMWSLVKQFEKFQNFQNKQSEEDEEKKNKKLAFILGTTFIILYISYKNF
jgi:hypothetical protein